MDRPQEDRQPTPAQAIGTAFHALVLEPKVFAQEYTLGLRRSDFPEAIDDKEVLVGMVEKLNAKRLPKLATTGSKAEQVERILAAQDGLNREVLDEMKGAELKQIIEGLNAKREGLLSVSGSTEQLAELLRANGQPVTLWRDLKAEWERNNGHRTVLTAEEWGQLHAMRDAVMAHPKAAALLSKKGKAEQSVYWRDVVTGVLCRCRPDYLTDDDYVVDLKSTEDASQEEFAKSVANYRYHVQHPFYVDGLAAVGRKPRAFVFIACEKNAPYAVGVYVLDAAAVELGRMQYSRDIAAYAECLASGQYPAYSERIENLALPGWYLNRHAQQLAA
jgi:exodeoxyribonuclease VIII